MPTKSLSLKENILWNSFGSIVYLGCQWLITVVVVRLSSDYANAGLLSLAMSIGNIFTPFAIYKIRTLQVSDVSHENSAREYMGFRLLTIFVAFCFCMMYAAFSCQTSALISIALYLLFKAVDLISDVMHGVDQQNMRMDYIGKSQTARGALSLLSFSVMLYLSGSLELSLVAMTLSTAPVVILYDYRVSSRFESLLPTVNTVKCKKLLISCFPAVVSSVFCSAVLTIPRQLLSAQYGDAALGIYSSVAAPVVIVQMGATYLYTPLLGRFAELYSKLNYSGFRKLLVKVSFGIALLAIVCSIMLLVFGEMLLSIVFGDSIKEYCYLLQPVLICTLVTAYLWFLSDLLVVVRDFNGNFIGNLISFCVSIPASFLFVSGFDMNGISFSGIFSYGVGVVYLTCRLLFRLRDGSSK